MRYEPRDALASGSDGLAALRVIVSEAPRYLAVGGTLLVEHGYDQGTACAELFRAAGFADVRTQVDLAGLPRVTSGVSG